MRACGRVLVRAPFPPSLFFFLGARGTETVHDETVGKNCVTTLGEKAEVKPQHFFV